MRYILAILAALAAFGTSAAGAEERPLRVAVSPFVYVSSGVTSGAPDAVVEGLQSWVVGAREDFDLASVRSLRTAVVRQPHYVDASQLGRTHAQQGIHSYRALDPAAAARSLTIAQDEFYRADHQFVAPNEVSEALLFRALALLDTGTASPNEPLDAMKEMVLIDPTRAVEEGSFPTEVVQFARSARLDLERDIREGGPGERFPRRIAALTAVRDGNGVTTSTDAVLVANVVQSSTGVELVVWLYDAESDQFQTRVAIEVGAPTPQRLRDAANRAASRLLTCLVEPDALAEEPLPPSSGSSPFALQLNLAYAAYYQFPDVDGQPVEPFDNLGASIGGALFLTKEFAIVAAFQFLASTSEYSGLVQPGFTTLRGFAGGEIGIGFGRVRVSLGTLMEVVAVSKITLCPGKTVEDRRFCREPVDLPSRVMFGPNARPRVSYRLLDALQVYLGGSTSFYILPLGRRSMNFLTTGEAGLQYRF